jgi:hypothetical protein
MRANLRTSPAIDAFFRKIPERILLIRVKHQTTPKKEKTPSAIARTIPTLIMSTITGT